MMVSVIREVNRACINKYGDQYDTSILFPGDHSQDLRTGWRRIIAGEEKFDPQFQGTWGGDIEIVTIVFLLDVNVNVVFKKHLQDVSRLDKKLVKVFHRDWSITRVVTVTDSWSGWEWWTNLEDFFDTWFQEDDVNVTLP